MNKTSHSLPQSMQDIIARVAKALPQYPQLPKFFADTFSNTYATTLRPQSDGSIFVITGDIPAMWLRDSAAQVRPYLKLAKTDPVFAQLISGVVKRQMDFVLRDPYANAFNESANGHCHNHDKTDMSAWIWERKYELDSLCAPIKLAHDLWQVTEQKDHLDHAFIEAAKLIVKTVRNEQRHENSPYTFERLEGPQSDTLANKGRGNPVAFTGMSWSGFRPSDDACKYNYLVPSNMFAVVALQCLAKLPLNDEGLSAEAQTLESQIRKGIEQHGKIKHPQFGEIYAYETDGLGNYNLMDDANVPSLLALPFMEFCQIEDPIYQQTRKYVLSSTNPYFYQGKAAKGIGSPHTPQNYIWPIALCIQGLTTSSRSEKLELLETLIATDAKTGLMHEAFDKDDPTKYTRPWFAWANSMFAEFVMELCEI
jgi:uncharacterized protein